MKKNSPNYCCCYCHCCNIKQKINGYSWFTITIRKWVEDLALQTQKEIDGANKEGNPLKKPVSNQEMKTFLNQS